MSAVLEGTLLKRLSNAARRRKDAEASAAKWRAMTDEMILEGYAAGVPKQVLAEAAGLTRQTIYTVILKAGER